MRIRQNPNPAASKQSGSGQLDSLPCSVLSPNVKQKTSDKLHASSVHVSYILL